MPILREGLRQRGQARERRVSVVPPRLAWLACLLLALTSCRGPSPADDARLDLPSGWHWEASESTTHPVGIGPASKAGVLPNVNISTNQWDGPVDPWIDQNIAFIEQTFTINKEHPTFVVSREDFTTEKGLGGTKVVFKNNRFQSSLWHVQYYFHTNDLMQVLSFTYPETDGPASIMTDKTAGTFRHYE